MVQVGAGIGGTIARVLANERYSNLERGGVRVMETQNHRQLDGTTDQQVRVASRNVVARAVSRLNQAICGMSGHDMVRHFEGKRVMVRCTSCGYESPGWEVSGQGPRRLFEGDARRHRIVREPRLVLRKTA
jgi:hypothetical protein